MVPIVDTAHSNSDSKLCTMDDLTNRTDGRSKFEKLDESEKSQVCLADDKQIKIERRGTTMTCHSVLFDDGKCVVTNKTTGKAITHAYMSHNRVFPLVFSSHIDSAMVTKTMEETELWHLRYGHLSTDVLELIHADLCSARRRSAAEPSIHHVTSITNVLELMKSGSLRRVVAATALNETNSRSHSVLTVHVRGTDLETNGVFLGRLNLVELARSERVIGCPMFPMKLALLRLKKIVSVDVTEGQAKTLMFVHLNPTSFSETISSLRFAESVGCGATSQRQGQATQSQQLQGQGTPTVTKGNSQVKDNKIDLLVQQFKQFTILEEESIDSDFARFNTIITSLKALDEGFSSKNYVRKFLRALHPKWRAKVTTIKESKDLSLLALDELIDNQKVQWKISQDKKEKSSSIYRY
ncbi:DUF4219 domain-containing protein [Tanacetum coccineum]